MKAAFQLIVSLVLFVSFVLASPAPAPAPATAAAGCHYYCPGLDAANNILVGDTGVQYRKRQLPTITCEYFINNAPNGLCSYDPNTGKLSKDGDSGKCQPAAVNSCSSRRAAPRRALAARIAADA
ncbi:hypothetical protein BOTBODRAFT_48743 [Botryobasidium botryosum FD-172 SS1]|uniref:Uncharacterized protein n=1 Tax=Botryobasidium botryosum (strain FD-172 SS1) TaxID=930990 RepID=A0A067LYU9_BOTB1|nr:hypothetical protein BOTBODRAFT_48743 [Botryobasidium botryosum FD-172 SS1]